MGKITNFLNLYWTKHQCLRTSQWRLQKVKAPCQFVFWFLLSSYQCFRQKSTTTGIWSKRERFCIIMIANQEIITDCRLTTLKTSFFKLKCLGFEKYSLGFAYGPRTNVKSYNKPNHSLYSSTIFPANNCNQNIYSVDNLWFPNN